jgi:hypothetical protein
LQTRFVFISIPTQFLSGFSGAQKAILKVFCRLADKIMHIGAALLVLELSGKTPMVFLPASVLYSMFYKDRQAVKPTSGLPRS